MHGPLFGNTTHLWVDAICINQKDLDERAAQVKIMGQIYSNSNGVMVWLGKSLPKTKRAVELMQQLSQIPEEKFGFMKRCKLSRKEDYENLGIEFVSLDDWRIVRSFMERDWFKRVWTVQEYCIPQFVTAISGEYQVPFASLFQVSDMLICTDWCAQLGNLELDAESSSAYTALLKECATGSLTGHSTKRYNEILRKPIQDLRYIENIHPGVQQFALVQIKNWLWPEDDIHEVEKVDLLERVQMIRGKTATDPRDKIHGLLDAINARLEKCPEIGMVVPNYAPSNPVELVYTDFVYKAIRRDGNLLVFTTINDEAFRRTQGLPSWVPDMSILMCPNRTVNRQSWSPFPCTDHFYIAPRLLGQYSLQIQGI